MSNSMLETVTMTEEEFDAQTYSDNVRTQQHCDALIHYLEHQAISPNGGWPIVQFGVLPSARDMMVRALKALKPSLPHS
jgi:hypothetical protein